MKLRNSDVEWEFVEVFWAYPTLALKHNKPYCNGDTRFAANNSIQARIKHGFNCHACNKAIPEELVTQWRLLRK